MIRVTGFAMVLLIATLAMSVAASAQQQASPPEPILRTTVDPPRVVVGQKTTLRIEVVVPNYMTSPPALPDFQVRNAVTRPPSTLNINERHDGITYAGVRFEFAIYPQEPGAFVIADQKVVLKYAAEPPAVSEVTLSLPRIEFEAFIPDTAAQLDPFVAASKLTIEQLVARSSEELKAGDAITRTVTIKAEGTPAMFLPPVKFLPEDGLALYPAQPSTQDSTDRRTDVLTATRQDAATYMLEKPGDYLLPAITIAWWNVRTNRVETARLDTIPLHVIDNPQALRAPGEEPKVAWSWDAFIDFIVGCWPLMLAGIAAVVFLIWLSPRVVRQTAASWRQRRDAYLASEAWAFSRLSAAARHGDTSKTYFALMNWLARFDAIAPSHTIAALKAAAQDHVLEQQLDAMEKCLFASHSDPQEWSPQKLLRSLKSTRRRLRRQLHRTRTVLLLPRDINPVAVVGVAGRRERRAVAR